MTTKDTSKKRKILIKSLVGFIIAVIAICTIFLISETELCGRVIGFIFYFLVVSFAIFEFTNIFDKILPKWTKFYFIFLPFLSFFAEWNDLNQWFLYGPSSTTILNYLITQQYEFSINGIYGLGYAISFVYCLIPFLFAKQKNQIIKFYSITFFVFTILIIVSKSLMFVNADSVYFLLLLYAGPIICDTFAYFGGSVVGNKIFSKKLAPKISPNKTIEGATIGYILTWLCLFLVFWFAHFDFLNVEKIYLVTIIPIIFPIVAIWGDLQFSLFKRMVNIKDFSNLIPGHGGLLDRLDSIILTSFVFIPLFIVV